MSGAADHSSARLDALREEFEAFRGDTTRVIDALLETQNAQRVQLSMALTRMMVLADDETQDDGNDAPVAPAPREGEGQFDEAVLLAELTAEQGDGDIKL